MRNNAEDQINQLIENNQILKRQPNCNISSASDVPLNGFIPASIEKSRTGKSNRQ